MRGAIPPLPHTPVWLGALFSYELRCMAQLVLTNREPDGSVQCVSAGWAPDNYRGPLLVRITIRGFPGGKAE
jgi:hypothetical protein